MSDTYFLLTSFPPLVIGQQPELSFREVFALCEMNLSARDVERVRALLEPIDLYNIRAFWLSEPLDPRGTLSEKELEEALALKSGLADYVVEFLEEYELPSERLKNFTALYASAYRNEGRGSSFLDDYFSFEREVRLLLTALRAKEKGRDIVKEFQFEDLSDSFLHQLLIQKDSPDLAVPLEYEDLKVLFMENRKDPYNLNQAALRFSCKWIEERGEEIPFSLDALLSYVARLILVESVFYKEEEKAKTIVEQLSDYE